MTLPIRSVSITNAYTSPSTEEIEEGMSPDDQRVRAMLGQNDPKVKTQALAQHMMNHLNEMSFDTTARDVGNEASCMERRIDTRVRAVALPNSAPVDFSRIDEKIFSATLPGLEAFMPGKVSRVFPAELHGKSTPLELAAHRDSHSQVPNAFTYACDFVEIAHHPLHLPGSIRSLQVLAAVKANEGSEHIKRDVAIDIGVETAVAAGVSRILGGTTPTGLVMLASHGAQHVKANFPGPSPEELGRLAVSLNPEERAEAQEWIRARAGAAIFSFPAEAMHVMIEGVKHQLDKQ